MKLGIIPCSKEKYWDDHPSAGAVPAKDAYTSSFHQLCRQYAEQIVGNYVIFSAKYGFLLPDDLIAGPYDVTFDRPRDPVVTDAQLVEQSALWTVTELLLLLPYRYAARVRAAVAGRGIRIECPFTELHHLDDMSAWMRAKLVS